MILNTTITISEKQYTTIKQNINGVYYKDTSIEQPETTRSISLDEITPLIAALHTEDKDVKDGRIRWSKDYIVSQYCTPYTPSILIPIDEIRVIKIVNEVR